MVSKERPNWVKVTGFLGMAFALLGILGSGQMLVLPRILSPEMLRKLLDVPEWFRPLSQVSDFVGFLVAVFYFYAALRFLSCTRKGLRLFTTALAVSTVFHLLKGAAAVASLSILGLVQVAGSFFWVVVNVALFIVVRVHRKDVFDE